MIDGSSFTGSKICSWRLYIYYILYTCLLNFAHSYFPLSSLVLVLLNMINYLSATLPNLRRVHLFWPPGGDRGPRFVGGPGGGIPGGSRGGVDRKSTRLNSSHSQTSY